MSTSRLQKLVYETVLREIECIEVSQNTRPWWLATDKGGRLELDIYIPSRDIAIEVQGVQHFQYVPFFHKTYNEFVRQKRRDGEKQHLCSEAGVTLYLVYASSDIEWLMREISATSIELETSQPNVVTIHNGPARHFTKRLGGLLNCYLIYKETGKLKTKRAKKRLTFQLTSVKRCIAERNIHPNQDANALVALVEEITGKLTVSARTQRERKETHKLRHGCTRQVRRRARRMSVKQFESHLYLVTGGLEPHVVWCSPYKWICDCQGWAGAYDNVCSHVKAVKSHSH